MHTCRRRRTRREQRGAAAVEFALIMPIFLLLLFGVIDFGYMINRGSVINNAARDAAREASLNGTRAQVTTVANDALSAIGGTTTVSVTCRRPATPPATRGPACGADYDSSKESGGTAVVSISYRHRAITPIGMFFPDGFNLNRTAEMRIE